MLRRMAGGSESVLLASSGNKAERSSGVECGEGMVGDDEVGAGDVYRGGELFERIESEN